MGATKVKYIVNRKTLDRAIPREAGWAIDAEKIAAIPVDPSLVDASEFKVDLVDSATIAEYTKVAEFCCGRALLPETVRLPPVLARRLAARLLALSRTLYHGRALNQRSKSLRSSSLVHPGQAALTQAALISVHSRSRRRCVAGSSVMAHSPRATTSDAG